jgi:hypothetical protein
LAATDRPIACIRRLEVHDLPETPYREFTLV